MKEPASEGPGNTVVPVVFKNDSGIQDHLGFGIEVFGAKGSRITLDVTEVQLNRQGKVHGGIISLLLDMAMGYGCSGHWSDDAQTPAITLSMSTSFIAPVNSGRLIASGHVTGGGYKILFAEAVLKTEDGTIIATSSGTMKRGAR